MEETQFLKANILWDKGELVSTNVDNKTSLYFYENCFFVIWYTEDNAVKKVDRISKEEAAELFDPNQWRLIQL